MATDSEILAAARSDAKFDGRDYDSLPRHERQRYFARSQEALVAAEHARKAGKMVIPDDMANLRGAIFPHDAILESESD